jgi:hypothetical protein
MSAFLVQGSNKVIGMKFCEMEGLLVLLSILLLRAQISHGSFSLFPIMYVGIFPRLIFSSPASLRPFSIFAYASFSI